MGVVVNPDSELGREMAKWEKPWVYVEYPRMLYKAFKRDNGKVMCLDNPLMYRDEAGALGAEAFNRQCQRIVRSDDERARAEAEGWRATVKDALDHFEALEQAIAQAAAEANFGVRRMSEQARAEKAAADAETHEHVTDVVPVKRGRPRAVSAGDARG